MSDEKEELATWEKKDDEARQKRVAHYQTSFAAFFEHSIEVDRQLLTLSTAAIGFLIFFYDKLEKTTECFWLLFLGFLFTGFFFIVTIGIILFALYINPYYIRCVIDNSDKDKTVEDDNKETTLSNKLEKLMKGSFITFISGVVSAFILMVFKSALSL